MSGFLKGTVMDKFDDLLAANKEFVGTFTSENLTGTQEMQRSFVTLEQE